MRIGVITGTGTYAMPGYGESAPERVTTPYGDALVARGRGDDGPEVLHVSRHDEGHRRLSNQVNHRANISALAELGADAVLAVTVLAGISLNAAIGWWWADPAAAFVIVYYAAREAHHIFTNPTGSD